jgi:serine/threonine protein kinase, bacterial
MMPLAAGETFAGYTIVALLGSGGMGEVYLARHPRLPRQDALKVLPATVSADQEYRARFNREADIAATLWHPHIVGVHDRGEYEGQIWISMDYVEGTDAAKMLARHYPTGMPAAEVAAIVSAVADALDYAHERHLLHRDVKPANILIARPGTADERVLLADFGIARWTDDVSGLTATNMTVGTVSYAPPEQLMGRSLDGRADQYALAATAFHLLTGSPPFRDSNPAVVISQHLSAPPPALGDLRPDLHAAGPAITRALAKDPGDRFERCTDFARALTHQLSGAADPEATRLSASAAAVPIPPRPSDEPPAGRPTRWRPAVLVAAVLAVLLIAAVAVAAREFLRADDEQRPTAQPTTSRSSVAPPPPPPPATTATTTPTSTDTQATQAPETVTSTEVVTTTATPTAPPAPAVGANCSAPGTTGTTASGATVYCETLQSTGSPIWSLTPGDIPSPTVPPPTDPVVPPAPIEEENPVRVCMQQTGQSWFQCRRDVRLGNGLVP